MTSDDIRLVKASFVHALPISDAVAASFYARLFAKSPHVRSLFQEDMTEQRTKLMMTLSFIVGHLDRLDLLLPEAVELARRHVRYGARDEHYAVVGQALIETLRDALVSRFTPEVERAWTAAYTALSGAMITGSRLAA